MSSVSPSSIMGERPGPVHLPRPAVGESGSSLYTAIFVEKTEDKGYCPHTLCSPTVPTPAPVALTRDTSLLTGSIPGRMLLPGFRDTCMSSGMKKDSLYQISNSAGRREGSTVRCWGGPEEAGKACVGACHRLTLCSLPALGSHPFLSPSLALRVLGTLRKPSPKTQTLSERRPDTASRTQAWPSASRDLRWPAGLPKWHTREQAVTTLVHQVLAVLDLSPEVTQVLILSPVLLLEVFELQDQQEFLLVNDHQPLVFILACRDRGGQRARCSPGVWGGRRSGKKEQSVGMKTTD